MRSAGECGDSTAVLTKRKKQGSFSLQLLKCFRVNGQTNREAMIRALDEVFEIHPNGCPEPRSFRSILSTAQEEYGKAHE